MAEEEAKTPEAEKASGGMKKTIGLVVIGLGVGILAPKLPVVGGFFPKTEPGTQVVVESPVTTVFNRLEATAVELGDSTVNLASGHYARVKVTVFMSAAGGDGHGGGGKPEELKPKFAKIVSDAEAFVSGKALTEVSSTEFKRELRSFLLEEAHVDYHGSIADIQVSIVAQ
jgi:hypothetical protein